MAGKSNNQRGKLKVSRTFVVAGIPISEEEWFAGGPTRETMEKALAAGIVDNKASDEKWEKIQLILRRAKLQQSDSVEKG